MTDKTDPKGNKTANGDAGNPAQPGGRSVEQIERDIEVTRADMGDTVEALAEKTDVKAQARKQADEVKAQAQEKVTAAKTKVTEAKEDLLVKAQAASPESARTAAAQVQQKARENPLPVAVGAAVLVGFVVGRLSKR
ncbi:MAG TPA: DUF3618 domain-containing protein [Solirubrobacteraceae bacterium]|jgi:ElaB/YqjD/DUF883 family membrane-anchored ribosome-binding protein|nr:DUF3618 domain-containing protein [Solirubrobacteraceae bacterium]